jgi:T-complex protein 1 subunit zeta
MSAISVLNPKAELARHAAALELNITGARGLAAVMKSNLGPKGTLKMLVSGGGDIKVTKDGNLLVHEMQIRHPTASMIAKACTAQNDNTGDGTTSTVLLIGELLKNAENYVQEGVHPHILTEGFTVAHRKTLEFLKEMQSKGQIDDETLLEVAKSSVSTKLYGALADHIAQCVYQAVQAIRQTPEDHSPDLHMVEIQQMLLETPMDTKFINGLVLDHGGRHPDMPKHVENAYILTCNVSLEFEKTEVNSGFFYKSAEEREKLLQAEREFITRRVHKIIELKKKLCDGKKKGFVIINQKGIDPPSLDLFAQEGILALRRAKRRNMERLQLACGGEAVNSVDDLSEDMLGFAGQVYEHVVGEDKFTFIEECKDPKAVTLLIKGQYKHVIEQVKDAIKTGMRAVANALRDQTVAPGAGAFEVAAHCRLRDVADETKGRTKLGIQAYADALLVIPKTLAQNAGHDTQDSIVKLVEAQRDADKNGRAPVGLDLVTGEPSDDLRVWDNYVVKRASLNAMYEIAKNLLEVDEVMQAGMSNLKHQPQQ